MAAVFVKVPEVVVGFVKEIQAVQTLHPSDLHFNVQVIPVVVKAVALLRFLELIHADGITFRNHSPIGRIAIDAWNAVGGKLENLVLDARAFDGEGGKRERQNEK